VSQDFVFLGLALAVLAVGLQYIPIEHIPKFLGRKPTKKDSIMIRRIIVIITSLAFLAVIFFSFKIIWDGWFYVFHLPRLATESVQTRGIIATICVATVVIAVGIIISVFWKASDNEEFEPSENEKLTTALKKQTAKVDELIDVLKQYIETEVKSDVTSKKTDADSVEKPNETKKE
jgi:hypothetical protein